MADKSSLSSPADPSTAIDLDNRFYVTHLSIEHNGSVQVTYSLNEINWRDTYVGGENGADMTFVWADNSCSSSYKGRLYCCWGGDFPMGFASSIYFSYSTNRAQNWRTPAIKIHHEDAYWLTGSFVETSPQGNVCVTWRICNPSTLKWDYLDFFKSVDGGEHWSHPQQFPFYIGGQNEIYISGGQSAMAVNQQTGEIFIMFPSKGNSENIYHLYFIKSSDNGENWSNPTLVYPQDLTVKHTYPSLSCDPETGILSCVYFSNVGNYYDTYVAVSTNSGNTWCHRKVNDVTGSGLANKHYISIAATKGITYPVWFSQINGVKTFISPIDIIDRDRIVSPPITESRYIAANSITTSGDFSGLQPLNTTFQAGYFIDLTDGFQAVEGSNFTAEIPYCSPEGGGDILRHHSLANITGTDKKAANGMPEGYKLHQNYPNPFNSSTIIRYDLKENINVSIIIYDIVGREVRTLVNEFQVAGYKSILWDGTNNSGVSVSTGLYFYKIKAGDFIESKKLIIIK